jgi:hypothetical protein
MRLRLNRIGVLLRMEIYNVHDGVGQVRIPCPDGRLGCAVAHSDFVLVDEKLREYLEWLMKAEYMEMYFSGLNFHRVLTEREFSVFNRKLKHKKNAYIKCHEYNKDYLEVTGIKEQYHISVGFESIND